MSADVPAGSDGIEGLHTYSYDAMGRRASKSVDNNGNVATTVYVCTITKFQDGELGQVLAEYVEGELPENPNRKFVYASYVDEPCLMVSGYGAAESQYWYHHKDLYSVIALTDAAGGVVEQYAYEGYGKATVLDAYGVEPNQESSVGNPCMFTGRGLDSETGIHYYRARYYDSELGRFINRDPIGYDGSQWNLYEYTSGQPLRRIDPTGMYNANPYWMCMYRDFAKCYGPGCIAVRPILGTCLSVVFAACMVPPFFPRWFPKKRRPGLKQYFTCTAIGAVSCGIAVYGGLAFVCLHDAHDNCKRFW